MKSKKFTLSASIAVFLIICLTLLYFLSNGDLKKVSSLLIHTNTQGGINQSAFNNLLKPKDPKDLLNATIEKAKCVFPDNIKKYFEGKYIVPGIKEDATTQDDYWILSAINPVVLNYVSVANVNYMIGGFKDASGACKKIAFVLNGEINVEDKSGMFSPYKIKADGNDISYDDYKIKFPIGSQIETYFLTIRPASSLLSGELCDFKPPMTQYYCTLQRVSEKYADLILDPSLYSEINLFPSDSHQLYVISTNTLKE